MNQEREILAGFACLGGVGMESRSDANLSINGEVGRWGDVGFHA